MRRIHFFRIIQLTLFFVFTANITNAQNALPPVYSGSPGNYVRTWDAVAPESNAANVLISSDITTFRIATQYIDGLGRPIQTVLKKGSLITDPGNPASSANAVDMVSTALYDGFGREQYKYLPSAANNTGGNTSINDGLFKLNPFQQQVAFYNTQLNGQVGETNVGANSLNWAYSQTTFESSPLNRVQENFAPGSSWVGSAADPVEANRKSIKAKFYFNTVTDAVRIWTVTNSGTLGVFGSYASTTTYPEGELFKNITVDENSKQVIEFKDKDGKVILKKVQLTATADDGTGSGHAGWLCTYYIYDDLNNLRCVIQPRGVELISSLSWALTDTAILSEQCFRYEYDTRNRMVVKKVPGAGEVYMVYDARDRLVLMQDANMRVGTVKWMYTQYDGLNRPIVSGLWNDASSFLTHYNGAYYSTSYPTLTGTTEELTRTFYDNYDWRASWSNPLTNTYNSTYDTYFQTSSNTTWPYPQANLQSSQITGLVTGTRIKVLGTTSTYLYTVNFYDAKGRLLQIQSQNITGGTDIATTQYTWAGQPLITILKQEKAGTNAQTTVMVTQLTYDDLGRVIKTEKKFSNTQFNSNAMSAYVSLAENQYDAIGHLKVKKIDPAYNSNAGLETLNYDYNIRGWLLGENRDFAKTAGSTTNYFGFDLGYDKNSVATSTGTSIGTYATPTFNGNIEGMVWKSKGDGEIRKYDFNYDAVNRLMKADFNQYTSGSFNKTANVDFSMKMGDGTNPTSAYDANGNIVGMTQNGLKLNASPIIDQLSYTYQTNTNKLAKVSDAIVTSDNGALGDFKDGSNGSTDDYSYDVNGNLALDNNKQISSITYNYLNLPSVITVTGKGNITYTYDAAGNKLQKTTVDNTVSPSKTTVTTYINGFVYQNDTLQFISHEEGRIRRKTDGTFAYDYFLKDHLGNVRMVLTDEQKIDIYPVATLETSNLPLEQSYYTISTGQIVNATSVTVLPAYVNHNIIPTNPSNPTFDNANSAKLYVLNKNTQNTGLGITLRVMSGDKLDIYGKSYYFQNNTGGTSANTDVTTLNILTGLLGGPTGSATNVHGAVTATQLNGISNTTGGINNLLSNQTNTNNATPQVPKAFINYLLFDDQFKCVGSGFAPVGANSVLTDYASASALHNIPVTKNGFVYIYCSNESPVDVFFDNLQVMQTRGPILEETHYYPFGLTMAGISSSAAGTLKNKYKFGGKELNSNEFSDGSGLELYDFSARNYDPQIGRWWSNDPKADKSVWLSPYNYCLNNPIKFFDPDGQFPYPIHVRAFIPSATLWGYKGDNRGYSTTLSNRELNNKGGVTSRVQQTFTVDPSKGTLTGGVNNAWSDPSFKGAKTATANPEGSAAATFDKNSATVNAKMAGSNPLATPSFDIDVKSSIKLTENLEKGILSVNATMKGDKFPSAEMFIGDTKGQQLMVIGSPLSGNPLELMGDNNRQMGNGQFDIKINEKGEFTGVVVGSGKDAKTYSVGDWNKMMTSKPTEEPEKRERYRAY
jgi:RHS repeat-associated protein